MIEKLYEKYLMECSNNSIVEAVAFELFKEKIRDKLSDMNTCHDVGVNLVFSARIRSKNHPL